MLSRQLSSRKVELVSMSGHSKWSTIKRQKEATDQQRGKIFTKLGKAISVAIKEGGRVTDPSMNFKLRLAIDKAKQANMPKANIQRAIDNAESSADNMQLAMYEGFGPGGTAIMVEVMTDNKNRTYSEIKQIFDKHGGTLGQSGSVGFMFERKGYILLKVELGELDEAILQIMDFENVEDVIIDDEDEKNLKVWTLPDNLQKLQNEINIDNVKIIESSLAMKPKLLKDLENQEQEAKLIKFLEKLEDNDDVQQVYYDVDV